jgi:hypothetical protein
MNKYILLFSLIFSLLLNRSYAQDDNNSAEKIESQKIAFITKKLDLTPTESQNFWPIYNQYRKELDALRKSKKENLQDSKKRIETMTDAELQKLIDENFLNEQKELDLKKKYYLEFKKVISIRKIVKLYRAEKEFTLQLVQSLNKEPKR